MANEIPPELNRAANAIVRAANDLNARCQENTATNEFDSDVTFDAGRLASACHHFPETVARFDEGLAGRIRILPEFAFLSDISNTSKHGTRRRPETQVTLRAAMTYDCIRLGSSALSFAFSGTEILSSSAQHDEIDVLDLVYSFAKGCAKLMGLDSPKRSAKPSSIFANDVIMSVRDQTISVEKLSIKFYGKGAVGRNGSREVIDPGPFKIQIVDMAKSSGNAMNVTHVSLARMAPAQFRAVKVVSTPSEEERRRCNILAYVSDAASSAGPVSVQCNCGTYVEYKRTSGSEVCECPSCRSVIGIFRVYGEGRIAIKNPDGSDGSVPIHS